MGKNYDDYKKMDNINNKNKVVKKTNFVAFVLRFVS